MFFIGIIEKKKYNVEYSTLKITPKKLKQLQRDVIKNTKKN